MAEGHGRGIAAMLAADAELDIRASLPAALDRQLHQPAHPFLVERGERVGVENILRRPAELEAAGPAFHGLLIHLAAEAARAAVAAVHVKVGELRGVVA